MQTWISPIGITYMELRERSSTAQPLLAMDRIIKQPPWWVSVGCMTLDTHDRPHGLRPQGRPSPQDDALRGTTLLGGSRKTSGGYPEDTTRSVRICTIPGFL